MEGWQICPELGDAESRKAKLDVIGIKTED